MKMSVILTVICLLFAAGCAVWQDQLTPANYDVDMVKYAFANEANIPAKYTDSWKSKTELDFVMSKMNRTHLKTQADLQYQMTNDLTCYAELAKKAEIYQQQAIKTAEFLFGSTGLLALGLGGLFGGSLGSTLTALYKNSTQYSEAEVAQMKENIKAIFDKERWTDAEVANEMAARILSVCQTLGITDMTKIQQIIETEKAKAIASV